MSRKQKVFAFDTTEQAWSFINIASTAGYTAYDTVSPAVNESVMDKILVPILSEYTAYTSDLARISRTVKRSTREPLAEHAFTFDKFVRDDDFSKPVASAPDQEEPMRLRARRHQELPQNRIRMVNHG